ncbi:gp72 [Escherichia phage phiEB49]|uniref:Gp72 n=1 Tax=Escherichia phage phiEB49 TaxID=1048207 RepID=F8UBY2_9CAUD|nr:gp72 [Escherichia phage phiEB49]AEI91272.1 gp72 [Escherichia phage phiEB49]
MITINLSEEQAFALKVALQYFDSKGMFQDSGVIAEALNQIRNQEFDEVDELPWDTDTAWSRYEQICTALSGCQLSSQYK